MADVADAGPGCGDVTTVEDTFRLAHADLPREAPGSEATTSLLLALARRAGTLPPRPRILDLGAGTGPATVPLVAGTGGTALAVDLHEPFLDALRARADRAGVADRVETRVADLHDLDGPDLDLPDGSADVVWSEGAAYLVGFDTALARWRRLLAPGGVLVLTEAEWTVAHPSPGARAFWGPGYPAMRTTAANVAAAVDAGWTVAATHLLPESDWATYYDPLAARIAELAREGVAAEHLAAVREEIDVRARHGGEYGYTGYVLVPRN